MDKQHLNLTEDEFEQIVQQAIGTIPKEFLEKLDNVAIVVEDLPSLYQLNKLRLRSGFFILGLYEGAPQTKRGRYSVTLPDKITIFKKPIETIAQSLDDLKEIVKNTVWHEVAHHFGMDETTVREAEKKRRERLPKQMEVNKKRL